RGPSHRVARAEDPALPVPAELRRGAVHRHARRVREARGHGEGLPRDPRRQARRPARAGLLYGRRDRRRRREGPPAGGRGGAGDDRVREYATGPGFFKVEEDRAIALVDDAVLAGEINDERARRQLEEAQAELERIDRGESQADRWQIEQRVKHAENQLAVSGRG